MSLFNGKMILKLLFLGIFAFKVQHSGLSVRFFTHHGLIFMRGMGAHVKKTVSSKKDLRPQTSDSAPIRGALRNDNRPWKTTEVEM